MIEATICEILHDGKLLLQCKAAGRFGEGKWTSPGGKIEKGESPQESVRREIQEETGLSIRDQKLVGVIHFYFANIKEPDWKVYVFIVEHYSGTISPNEEGILQWFSVDDLPFSLMWPDNFDWIPLVLKGNIIQASYWYDNEGKNIIRQEVEVGQEIHWKS